MAFRRTPDRTTGLPAGYELHGVKFLGGRGRPRGRNNPDIPRDERLKLFKLALDTIAVLPGLDLDTFAVRTTDRGKAYHRCLSHMLTPHRRVGNRSPHLLVVDGDGTDPTYRRVHRSLYESRDALPGLIEDPMFQPSASHQMIQIVDLVAYAAFQELIKNPRYPERHSLYSEHLWPIDSTGPVVLSE